MKILHIGKYFPPFHGGMEKFLHGLAHGQAGDGHEVTVVVHQHDRGKPTEVVETAFGHGMLRVVRVAILGTALFTPLAPAPRGVLSRLARDFNPDVIHLHLPNPSAAWILTVPALKRTPVVTHWHADIITRQASPLFRAAYACFRPLEQALLQRSGAIIATSPNYLASSQPLASFRERCTVVPLGISPPSGAKGHRPRTRHTGDTLNVLAVGRLSYYKGYDVLIRAVAMTEGVRLTIVGEGEKRPELERLINEVGVSNKVVLAGSVSESALATALQSADCFCLPSTERTEAFGMALLEAMSYSLPIVASNIPGSGVPWVLEGGCGLLVEPGRPESLSGALITIRDNPELAVGFGQRARARVATDFSLQEAVFRVQGIYGKLGTQPPPG